MPLNSDSSSHWNDRLPLGNWISFAYLTGGNQLQSSEALLKNIRSYTKIRNTLDRMNITLVMPAASKKRRTKHEGIAVSEPQTALFMVI